MGNNIVQVQLNENKNTLTVDGIEYELTPGLHGLIMRKHPRPTQYNSNDYRVHKSLCAQTKVRSFPNPAGTARPYATWKYMHMPRKMVIPGERIKEEGESEDNDDTDTASIGDIDESSDISSPGILSPGTPAIPPSPAHTHLWKS